MPVPFFFEEIQPELDMVEEQLHQWVAASHPLLNRAATHLVLAGGKRLRPALALLTGRLYNYHRERLVTLAVALELIHMATLVHDDVVDASLVRRGRPTVKARWGDQISVHTGDYLFSRALNCIAACNDPRVATVLGRVSVFMCQGEITQLLGVYDSEQSGRQYLYRIKYKTALLLAASSSLGAAVAGAPEADVRRLAQYGYYVGMAFQITDDVLDFIADPRELGKPVGSDLRDGIITLPVILSLRASPRRERLQALVTSHYLTEEELHEALQLVSESGAIEASLGVADKYLAKARRSLQQLTSYHLPNNLVALTDFVGNRKY